MSKRIVRFAAVTALFQSIDGSVAAGNRLDKAYALGVGKPEYHTPFDVSNPQAVAMNQAGLYAADTAANVLAVLRDGLDRNGKVTEESYTDALVSLSKADLNDDERYIVKNEANLAWRSGQPFRDIATKPLNRITREVNQQFNQLPPDEEDKDLIQIIEGAKILLELAEK